jgi:hypothetical protein
MGTAAAVKAAAAATGRAAAVKAAAVPAMAAVKAAALSDPEAAPSPVAAEFGTGEWGGHIVPTAAAVKAAVLPAVEVDNASAAVKAAAAAATETAAVKAAATMATAAAVKAAALGGAAQTAAGQAAAEAAGADGTAAVDMGEVSWGWGAGELMDMEVVYQDAIADEMFSEDEKDWGPRCQQLWLDLGSTARGWEWQRDTVALAVALVTGNDTAFGRSNQEMTDDWCGWVGSNMDRAVLREGM